MNISGKNEQRRDIDKELTIFAYTNLVGYNSALQQEGEPFVKGSPSKIYNPNFSEIKP